MPCRVSGLRPWLSRLAALCHLPPRHTARRTLCVAGSPAGGGSPGCVLASELDAVQPPGLARCDLKKGRIFTLANALTPEECDRIVRAAEAYGFEAAAVDMRSSRSTSSAAAQEDVVMNTDVRLNERIVLDSPELAAALFARLEGVLPPKFKDLHLNSFASCVRLYKYGPGNYFKPHTDAGFEDEVRGTTFVYTTLFYLNTVQRGGETSFFGGSYDPAGKLVFTLAASPPPVEPRKGHSLAFFHKQAHAGEKVLEGVKYVMRLDLMYHPKPRIPSENPEHFTWVGLTAPTDVGSDAEPGAVAGPRRTLLVFDFDCTLSSVHLFHYLRSPVGQRELKQDADGFYTRIFGGAERIAALQAFLRGCSALPGSELRVLSFGYEEEIRAALDYIGVTDCFEGVYGSAAYEEFGVTSAEDPKQQMLTMFQLQSARDSIVFIDDDRANFPPLRNCDRAGVDPDVYVAFDQFTLQATSDQFGAGVPAPARGDGDGVSTRVVQSIFPAGARKDAEGLTPVDMAEIQAFVVGEG